MDVLVYSGYPLGRLRRQHPAPLALCDAVVTGRYVDRRNTGLRWRGSANQRIVPLTSLGHTRYDAAGDRHGAPNMQVTVDGMRVWYIGIPRRGDMERVTESLQAAGITELRASWRP